MFNERLKQARLKANLSKASFAKRLGLIYTTYDNYERGTVEPKVSTLIKIADILDVSLDELLGRSKINEDEQLKKELNVLLSSIEKEKNISIKVNSIDKEYVNFSFILDGCYFPISVEKKSIVDNINFINDLTNMTKRNIFQKRLNDAIANVIQYNILNGAPVNKFSMVFYYLQSVLSSTIFIQDYENNKKLFPQLGILIHEPKLIKEDK